MLKASDSGKVSYTLAQVFLVLISWLIITVATKIKFKNFYHLVILSPQTMAQTSWLKTVGAVPVPVCSVSAVITQELGQPCESHL